MYHPMTIRTEFCVFLMLLCFRSLLFSVAREKINVGKEDGNRQGNPQ